MKNALIWISKKFELQLIVKIDKHIIHNSAIHIE